MLSSSKLQAYWDIAPDGKVRQVDNDSFTPTGSRFFIPFQMMLKAVGKPTLEVVDLDMDLICLRTAPDLDPNTLLIQVS